ncbi:predicted protein [Plenodomus lingam JN3]|uniref:Uncharacterized protein n=1 Tax=Leptosphaeria maculans (strain JN3 / isolate v23.1.3 / race Av1-4-5-6-7-8) TaxID=985895 RepID=E5A6K0_LEPMJ|nr:predicted protein [Plenodomus lingam JN3]CBX99245.1 predicted protein [Plenodomus lingam JN3]
MSYASKIEQFEQPRHSQTREKETQKTQRNVSVTTQLLRSSHYTPKLSRVYSFNLTFVWIHANGYLASFVNALQES